MQAAMSSKQPKEAAKKSKKKNKPVPIHDPANNSSRFGGTIVAKAPEGIICNSVVLQQPRDVQPRPPADPQSHEVLGGIILGSGHHNLAQGLLIRPVPIGPNHPLQIQPTPPTASGKAKAKASPKRYLGVTFRQSRLKYQSRIYKGNREYNIGLFDLAADSALAYDITHRLMAEILTYGEEKHKEISEEVQQREAENKDTVDEDADDKDDEEDNGESGIASPVELGLEKLTELENDTSQLFPALEWLDNPVVDTKPLRTSERLNFVRPKRFFKDRKNEIKARKLKPSSNHSYDDKKSGSCPDIPSLKIIIRNDAIRVAKLIMANTAGIPLEEEILSVKKKKRDEDALDFDEKKRKHNPSDTDDESVPSTPNGANQAKVTSNQSSGPILVTGMNPPQVQPMNGIQMQQMNTMNNVPAMNNMMAPGMQYPAYPNMNQFNQAAFAMPQNYNMMQYQPVGHVMPNGYNMMPMYGASFVMPVATPAQGMMMMSGQPPMDGQMAMMQQQQHQLYQGMGGMNSYQGNVGAVMSGVPAPSTAAPGVPDAANSNS